MSTIKAINIQHPSSANTNIVMDANGNMTVAGTVSTGSPMSGMRNRIINGDMRIDQRNAGASSVPSAGTYSLDRWYCNYSFDGAVTIQRSSSAPAGFTNSLLITTTTADASIASNQYFGIRQRIEGYNVADLAFGTSSASTITVSFWVQSSITGSCGLTITNSADSRLYVTSFTVNSANTWEYKTIVIPGDTSGAGTWNTDNTTGLQLQIWLAMGSGYQGTGNVWNTSYYVPTGISNFVGVTGATFYITGVQLERGSIATPFERRMYGQELALCQRYYHSTLNSPNGYKVGWMGIGSGNYAIHGVSTFPVPMRTNPTITAYAYGLGAGTAQELDGRANVLAKYTFNVGNSYQSHTYGLTPIATHNAIIAFNCGDNSTQGATYTCGYTASAEL